MKIILTLAAMLPFTTFAQTSLPSQLDLRPFFYEAKDQMFRGSCATFASIAAMEVNPGIPRLSEAYAYSNLKANDLTFDGASLDRMKSFLESTPMVEASLMRYESIGVFGFNSQNATEVEIAKAYNRSKAGEASILKPFAIYQAADIQVFKPSQISVQWLKENLARGQSIVGGFQVRSAEWSAARSTARIGDSAIMKLMLPDGGHAVMIVGYNNRDEFIIRNSWGPTWGEQGYAYMTAEHLLANINSAMIIGKVVMTNLGISPLNNPEKFEIKSNAKIEADYSTTAFLSFVLTSNTVTHSNITGTYYALYTPNSSVPFAQGYGNNGVGFPLIVKNLPSDSFQACVTIYHSDLSTTTGCRPVANAFTWTPAPIIH